MSSRRFKTENDSLEMLLDTMCNLFGGIILLALMVTLIAKDAEMSEKLTEAEIKTREMREKQLMQLEEELRAAQKFQQDLASQAGDPEVQEQVKMLQQRETIQQTLEELRQELEKTKSRLEESAESLKELEEMKQSQAVSAAAAQQEDVAQPERMRLPREHETEKSPAEIIVKNGMIYPVNFYQNGTPVSNTAGFVRRDVGQLQVLEPIEGKGMNPRLHSSQLSQFFRSIPAGTYLVFRVYGDSFSEFNEAKKAASESGLELSWMPIEKDVNVVLGGGVVAPPRPL